MAQTVTPYHYVDRFFRKGWWQDVLLWLCLAAFAAWAIPHVLPQGPKGIVLRFKDSSELTAGSPVRLMGTEVGWVRSVRFRGDHVQVKLGFYRDAPRVPEGAYFTIEFTGIAGAKCVEIMPPKQLHTPEKRQPYVVVEPIRIADVQRGGLLVVDSMKEGSENIARFLGPESNLEANRQFIRDVDSALFTGSDILADAVVVERRAYQGLDHATDYMKETLDIYANGARALDIESLYHLPHNLKLQDVRLRRQLLSAKNTLNTVKQPPSLMPAAKTVQASAKNLTPALTELPVHLNKAQTPLIKAKQQLKQIPKALEKAEATMRTLKQNLISLNQKVAAAGSTGSTADSPDSR